VLALAVAGSLVLAACGDDDDESASGGDAGSDAPQRLSIDVSGSEKAPSFTAPDTAEPGPATIELTNGYKKDDVDGQLVFTAEEHSDQEVVAQLKSAIQGKPVADWFQGAGGPPSTAPGETSRATQTLDEGSYYVLPTERPKLPLTKIEVSGAGGGEAAAPAARISAADYSFTGEGVKAGAPVLLENTGKQWHHFLASKLKPGATIAEARKFLTTEKGRPPFAGEEGALNSTVLDAGYSQVVEWEGGPGRYALFCFISDKRGGPPHVAKGMVSEVEVQ
jgi:hypothetical protein